MSNTNKSSNNKRQQCAMIFKSDIESLQKCSASEALVFMVYALHADKNRVSFPSSKTIMQITNLSRGSVMRAIKRLKENSIIQPMGQTPFGVVKYKLRCTKSDTRISSDTCIESDTRPESDTPPRLESDTPPVSDMTPITANIKTNNNNLLIAASNDEKIFLLLWEKWKDDNLCKWESLQPLKEYRTMRDSILALWKNKNINKDLIYELQVIDLYLMEGKEDITGQNGEWSGAPRLWGYRKWVNGITKWLSSPTPSRVSDKRKQYIPNVINIEEPKVDNTPEAPSKQPQESEESKYLHELRTLYKNVDDDYELLNQIFLDHYRNTPFPNSLRNSQYFYEYFYTIDSLLGNGHE